MLLRLARPVRAILLAALAVSAGSPALAQDRGAGGMDPDRLRELIEETVASRRDRSREVDEAPADAADALAKLQVRRLLDRRRVTVNFAETRFTEALDFLRDVTGLNVVLSKRAAEAVEEREVDLRLAKVTLRSCLELLLELTDPNLRYGVRHGVLWIGLRDEWPKRLELRILDVADLIHAPPDFPGPRLGLEGVVWDD